LEQEKRRLGHEGDKWKKQIEVSDESKSVTVSLRIKICFVTDVVKIHAFQH